MSSELKDAERAAMFDLLNSISTAQSNEDIASALIDYRCAVMAVAYEDAARVARDALGGAAAADRCSQAIRLRARAIAQRAPA